MKKLRAQRPRKRRTPEGQTHSGQRPLRLELLEDRRMLAVVTVDTVDDIVDFNDGVTSLREAIFVTNTVTGPDEIDFDFGFDGPATILLTEGELQITDSLTIHGPGADLLTIDASGNDPTPDSTLEDGDDANDFDGSRILNIDDGQDEFIDVELHGMTLTGGDSSSGGGAVSSTENLRLVDSVLTGNSAFVGGAVDFPRREPQTVSVPSLHVVRSTLRDNQSRGPGGAINAYTTYLSVAESTIADNLSQLSVGGGISSIFGTDLKLVGSVVSNNRGVYSGGGIVFGSEDGELFIGGSTISNNTLSGPGSRSTGGGGGVSAFANVVTIEESKIVGNTTVDDYVRGGGVYFAPYYDADVTIRDSEISGNSTAGEYSPGGGIFVGDGSVTVSNSSIHGNSTTGNYSQGGGIYISRGYRQIQGSLTISDSTVSSNSTSGERASGGGLATSGLPSLEINRSQINNNTALGPDSDGGGLFSYGGLTRISTSEISNNSATRRGGGIGRVGGGFALHHSTIAENSAASGGGISAVPIPLGFVVAGVEASLAAQSDATDQAGLTIQGSTIVDNQAVLEGGGIAASSINVAALNSTLSGNHAEGQGGGLYLNTLGQTNWISHATIASNSSSVAGGGIFARRGNLAIDHAIVASNSSSVGPDLTGLLGVVLEPRYSLVGNNLDSGLLEAPVGSPDADGNLVGGSGRNAQIDPRLGELADNGGPTWTRALLAGSLAINAGDPNYAESIEFDQRGAPFVRVADGRIDMGAYERQSIAGLNLVVDKIRDESDGDFSPGDLSLREAVGLANGSIGADTITFDAATFASTRRIRLAHGEIAISDAVAIDATAITNLTLDAQEESRVLNITTSEGDFTLAGLTITGGLTTGSDSQGTFRGGGIRSATNGKVTLKDTVLKENRTLGSRSSGGGISTVGALTVIRSTVSGNSIAGSRAGGGGIHSGGNLALIDSTVVSNSAAASGGGVSNPRDATLIRSTVSGNIAGTNGGGVTNAGSLMLIESTIHGNSASGNGGGVSIGGDATIIQSTLSGNSAGGNGGAVFDFDTFDSKTITLLHTTVTDNYALDDQAQGGGVYSFNNTMVIQNSIVADNSSNGFAVDIRQGSGSIEISYSLLSHISGTRINNSTGPGNLLNRIPRLAPLADNGGPTLTHAPMPGSFAIDAGDPALSQGNPDLPEFDQRGAPFARVAGGRIDIGAFEVQPAAGSLTGDFDADGDVDGSDFLTWQRGYGTAADAQPSDGDATSDGDVDQYDLAVLQATYGQRSPEPPVPPFLVASTGLELRDVTGLQELARIAPSPRPDFVTVEHTEAPVDGVRRGNSVRSRAEYRSNEKMAPSDAPDGDNVNERSQRRAIDRALDEVFAQLGS